MAKTNDCDSLFCSPVPGCAHNAVQVRHAVSGLPGKTARYPPALAWSFTKTACTVVHHVSFTMFVMGFKQMDARVQFAENIHTFDRDSLFPWPVV